MSSAPWQKITVAYTYICGFRSRRAARRDRKAANRLRALDAADTEKELHDALLVRLRLLENSLDMDASKIKSEWNTIESSINSPHAKLAALRTLFTALSIQHSKLAKQHSLPVNLSGAATDVATSITVETSAGDLIDRLTILEIKLERKFGHPPSINVLRDANGKVLAMPWTMYRIRRFLHRRRHEISRLIDRSRSMINVWACLELGSAPQKRIRVRSLDFRTIWTARQLQMTLNWIPVLDVADKAALPWLDWGIAAGTEPILDCSDDIRLLIAPQTANHT